MEEDIFYEEQKFTQKWLEFVLYFLWASSIVVSLFAFLGKKAGPLVAIVPFLVVSIIVLLFHSLKLQTRITSDGIYYRFLPFQRKFRFIKKSDIDNLEVKSYEPISEYGGWGIKFGKNGMAYNVKGNKGIYITLTSRKHILIGTSEPSEVELFLKGKGYI
jgi:hypothetical protein